MKADIYEYLKEKLELFTNEEYGTCNLAIDTKRILCDIGLPKEPLDFIQFDIVDIKNVKLDDEHIVIGNDFGTKICINSKEEIVSVDPDHEYPIRFINRNLESLIKCMLVFLEYEDKFADTDDEKKIDVIAEIKKNFNEIDIFALGDEENWWSVILEQIE